MLWAWSCISMVGHLTRRSYGKRWKNVNCSHRSTDKEFFFFFQTCPTFREVSWRHHLTWLWRANTSLDQGTVKLHTVSQIQTAPGFHTIHDLRAIFTFLNDWGKNQEKKTILQHVNMIWNSRSSCLKIKFWWNPECLIMYCVWLFPCCVAPIETLWQANPQMFTLKPSRVTFFWAESADFLPR